MNEESKQLAKHLLEGKADESYLLLANLLDHGWTTPQIYQFVVAGAMQHIGFLWEQDEVSVADEHLATATCDFMMARFHSSLPKKKSGKKAMFLCVEEERHTLGMKMAAFLFEEQGWKTRMMGADLPLEHALSAAKAWQPDAICLSVTLLYHVPILQKYTEELGKLPFQPQLIVGSRLLSMYDLSKYCNEKTLFMTDYEKLIQWITIQNKEDASGVF